ncbi:hypothetical protein, conserved [Babesia ovata]|uniref:Extracellular matrix-binding ebh n=1 Tax=Babesia ovata TaxID=189622 RepID=A0A2H6KKH9_9APIC|nr:uncharacterized protein BOVATA_049710 [Babesia ovata]GBE63478.1 hypothetical protein, conserved [Babesia ovata]
MSFLHGVLHTVKDDDSVKKYDGYINKGHKFDEVSTSLKNSVGRGSMELSPQLIKVGALTKRVTDQLGELKTTKFDESMKSVSDSVNDNLQGQLEKWKSTLQKIEEHINTNIITNVSNLDPALSDKIKREIEPVQKVVAHLGKVAGDGGLEMMVTEVDNELLQQKNKLEGKINMQTHIVQVTLDEEFGKILKNMNILHRQRHEHFKVIRDSLDVAKLKVDEWLGNPTGTTRVEILGFLDEVTTQINGVYTTLLSKKFDLDKLVEQTQEHFETLKKNTISLIGKNEESIEYNWKILKAKVTLLCESISYGYDGTSGHLGEIENKVKDYAGEFSKEKFKSSVVDEWLNDVLRTGGTVDLSIDAYILSNKRSGYFQQQDQGGIKQKVIKHIRKVIDSKLQSIITGVTAVENSDKAGIATNLTKIKTCIDSFVQELTKSMQSAEFKSSKIVPEIVAEYDSDSGLVVKSKKDTQADNLLYSAFNRILKHLTERAKKASTERAWLDGTTDKTRVNGKSTIANEIDEAIKKVELIGKEFKDGENSKQSHGKKLDAALKTVKQEIDTLTPLLNKAAKSGSILKKLGEMSPPLATLERIQRNDATGEINKKRKDVDDKMQALRDNIAAVITAITLNVDKADKSLYEAIDAVDKSARSAQRIAEDSVKQLENALLQQVKTSFTTLTNSVHSLFSASHAADLQALRALVDQQLREVQNIIARDAVTGVKGMLKWMKGTGEYSLGEIQKIVPTPTQPTLTAKDHSGKFKDLSTRFEKYADKVLVYIEGQVKTPNKDPSQDPESNPQSDNVHDIQGKLDYLLNYLKRNTSGNLSRPYNFDHTSNELLDKLKKSVSDLTSPNFHGFQNPLLLDALKSGMRKFTEQLSHAYVNKYSGLPLGKLVETKSDGDTEQVLSTEGRNCAKVCLTIVDILDRDMYTLKHSSLGGWKNDNIISTTKLGAFLKECGYIVSDSADKQNGQLDRHHNGENICKLFSQKITYIAGESKNLVEKYFSTKNGVEVDKIIKVHYTMFDKYRYVCHLKHVPNAKPPTTVCQMLHWLAGLYWNRMYNELRLHFDTWFKASTNDYKLSSDSFDVAAPYRDAWTMKATVSIKNIKDLFNTVTLRSYEILRAFVGHGHADGRYACEFYTNPDNLEYPNDISKCFDMLVDICLRLNYQLHFLYTQCCNGPDSSGWRDCHYGRHVGGSNWSCNKLQCPGQQGDQSANQIANQTCEQHPKCCKKSPPSIFGRRSSRLPPTYIHFAQLGIPCITPMGFTDIGIAASHTKTGAHLKSLLQPFCSSAREPLTMLCAFFTCLIRRPPQTLGDMFAFYYNFLEHWGGHYDGDKKTAKEHKQEAFQNAVTAANFGRPYVGLDPTTILCSSTHSNSKHNMGDLFGLLYCNLNSKPNMPCGQYLQPLSSDVHSMFHGKHAGRYLSWIVYMTETFYDLLKKLYDDCCAKCGKPNSRCYQKCCADNCAVKLAYEAEEPELKKLEGKNHDEKCHSIVNVKTPIRHCIHMASLLGAHGT